MLLLDPNIDITTNESKPVYFQSPIYDITTCPLANAYQEAIEQANQVYKFISINYNYDKYILT